MGWKTVRYSEPPQNTPVLTKIEDERGTRNVQRMTKSGNMWWLNDRTYAYYAPTHWKEIDGNS